MTNDEMNRKISEARGWVIEHDDDLVVLVVPAGKRYYSTGMTGTVAALESALYQVHTPDWTGSEDASAALRNELAEEGFEVQLRPDGVVVRIWLLDGTNEWIQADEWKKGIALAWLKWKGLA